MLQIMKNALTNFFRWLDSRSLKQDYWLCLLLGALNALAMPPVYCVPILLITFPLLIKLLDKSLTGKQVFIKTFLFFFAFHVFGLYWINFALFIDFAHNWWVMPFALSGLPMLMAIYPALGALLWHRLAWQGPARLLLLTVLWALSDWLRGWVMTGFPWNLWGYTWAAFAPMLQSVALMGMYGLTFLTLIFACLPMFFSKNYRSRFSTLFCIGFAVLMLALLAWGAGRLATPLPHSATPYTVRIVQPNISQEAKWQPGAREAHDRKLWAHTMQVAKVTPDMVLWPETSMPLVSTSDVRLLQEMLPQALSDKTILAAGVAELEENDTTQQTEMFNRIGFYNRDGQRLGAYDKFHLVPFGEFLPFEKYWPVKPVALSNDSMSRGVGVRTFHLPHTPPFSALICYEVLFPGAAVLEKDRPQWIVNATNDGWYGNTSGPYQHLAITRSRAVEEGLPVVRAANTGISAVIDPMGRVVASLPLNSEGIIDQALPASLAPTLFARFGNNIFFAMLVAGWLFAWFWQIQRTPTLRHVD